VLWAAPRFGLAANPVLPRFFSTSFVAKQSNPPSPTKLFNSSSDKAFSSSSQTKLFTILHIQQIVFFS